MMQVPTSCNSDRPRFPSWPLKIDVGQLHDMTTLRALVRAVPLLHCGHVRALGFHCVARFGLHLLSQQIELLDLRCGCKEFLGTRRQCLRYLTSDMSVPPVFVRKGIEDPKGRRPDLECEPSRGLGLLKNEGLGRL